MTHRLICISGSSGVGKTTIATLIRSMLGDGNTTHVSGDDLHRWERNDPVWKKVTHLDPSANMIELGHSHIASLVGGQDILRSRYNHDTGKFDADPVFVSPKEWIIYEGLHALWHEPTFRMADLRIFVDTDESLKTEWKVKRDTKKRGYTESEVMDTIRRRREDEKLYISPQRSNADVVIRFSQEGESKVSLDYTLSGDIGDEFMSRLKDFYDSTFDFLWTCRSLSMEPHLVQGRGGNVSVKSDNGEMIITRSGCRMEDVSLGNDYCVCRMGEGFPSFSSEGDYLSFVQSLVISGAGRPSMESGFHAVIPHRVVAHTHPIHLNAVLCSTESRRIVHELFSDTNIAYIPYTAPGFRLTNAIMQTKIRRDLPCAVFLENHGVIVGSDDRGEAVSTINRINDRCMDWLGNRSDSFVERGADPEPQPLFPDAAVLPSEMFQTNRYILRLMEDARLSPRFLTEVDVRELNGMDSEKHRKALA